MWSLPAFTVGLLLSAQARAQDDPFVFAVGASATTNEYHYGTCGQARTTYLIPYVDVSATWRATPRVGLRGTLSGTMGRVKWSSYAILLYCFGWDGVYRAHVYTDAWLAVGPSLMVVDAPVDDNVFQLSVTASPALAARTERTHSPGFDRTTTRPVVGIQGEADATWLFGSGVGVRLLGRVYRHLAPAREPIRGEDVNAQPTEVYGGMAVVVP